MRLDLQECEVTQENVESFPVEEVLGRFLGGTYFLDREILDPLFYGLPISRRRLYVKMHLGRCSVIGLAVSQLLYQIGRQAFHLHVAPMIVLFPLTVSMLHAFSKEPGVACVLPIL